MCPESSRTASSASIWQPTAAARSILKGDNNSVADTDPVIPAQVQGRLWYSVPYVGFVNTAVSGDIRAWVVPAGGVLLLLYAAVTIVRGIVGARRKRLREP